MPPIVEGFVKTLGYCSLAIYSLLMLWTSVREWRHFLLKEPYRPAPRWVEYLTSYLWLLTLPWFADDLVRHWPHADTKSLFVAGVFGFYLLLGLASKRWGSKNSAAPAKL